MSGERLPPSSAPLDHHLFDEVCGLSDDVTHSSTPPSTSEFAEWTPSDLWFPSYQNLLQGAPHTANPLGAGETQADTAGPDRSHSSNASAAGGLHHIRHNQLESCSTQMNELLPLFNMLHQETHSVPAAHA